MQQDSEINYQYIEATDVGCVRELNEDSVFSKTGLWIVADGMGGHACGEVASAMAVAAIVAGFAQHGSLDSAIQSAHEKITQAGKIDDNQSGMGTTVVAMNSDEHHYQVAWVGDSRAYLWDDKSGKLSQISEDHSLMVRLINAGLISKEDALTHPQRHMITQCLGSTEIEQVTVDSVESDWEPGQQVLLCSDGLTDEVTDDIIAQIMKSNLTTAEKSESLVNTAKQAGGRDNISLIIINSPKQKNITFMDKIRKLIKW